MLGVVRRLVSQAFPQRLRPRPQAIQRRSASQAVNQMLQLQQMDMCADPPSRGLVVGVFADETDRNDAGVLTAAGWRYNVQKTAGRLLEVLRMSGPMPKRGEARLFFAIEPERRRRGGRIGSTRSCNRIPVPSLDLYARKDEVCDLEGWRIGLQKAAAQNLTRQLQEMPSNLLTPTAFAQNVVEVLCKSRVNVEVKVEGWAESQSMHAFLAVGKASCEPPIFLELTYYGTCAEERPIVLVGQGVTYDAGGLCLKEKHELFHMRGDMTGAAVVVACCRAVAGLRLPVNIRGLIPLCENVVGCNSVRTGDMVKSMNGKTIEIQCTDHEDVLVLADALLYAQNFCPKCIIDVGTCSGYMRQALDESAAGVFTNSEILWQQIKHASMHTGDRVWRFPLWKYYSKAVRAGGRSDVQNYGIDRGGRPCKAAAFLREFVPCGQWMHIDATNVMVTKGFEYEYLRKGMAGRPTRTLVEFIAQTICKDTAPRLAK
ncbi:GL25353 [Drosophila persimilis]|uniref:Cytosol aminopeptidase n=1 Tax=Drosophila persimilis TaxID=7234 RepID=B4IQU0_DROPE|nr:GL25353 [Drosophila persimilis]